MHCSDQTHHSSIVPYSPITDCNYNVQVNEQSTAGQADNLEEKAKFLVKNPSAGFFERFHNHLRDFQCDDVIIGGDFNLVLDIDIDKKGGLAKTHTKAVQVIKDHMAELDLVDVWRLLNPDGRRYTWRRQKPEIQCRLDFFL